MKLVLKFNKDRPKLSEKQSYRAVGLNNRTIIDEDVSGYGIFSKGDAEKKIKGIYPDIEDLKILVIYVKSDIYTGSEESNAYVEHLINKYKL